jgi:opacity protein-like surface antigen
MNPKSILSVCLVAALACLAALTAAAADAVQPATLTITNYRGQASAQVSAQPLFQGATLLFTNCPLLNDVSPTGAVQGLNGVAVDVAIGNAQTNVHYAANIVSTNLGLWSQEITVPPLNLVNIQVRITDALTNVYYYPWLYFSTTAPM